MVLGRRVFPTRTGKLTSNLDSTSLSPPLSDTAGLHSEGTLISSLLHVYP
jgi:hypothetical protein